MDRDLTRLSNGLVLTERLTLVSSSVEEDFTRWLDMGRSSEEVERSAREPGEEGECGIWNPWVHCLWPEESEPKSIPRLRSLRLRLPPEALGLSLEKATTGPSSWHSRLKMSLLSSMLSVM